MPFWLLFLICAVTEGEPWNGAARMHITFVVKMYLWIFMIISRFQFFSLLFVPLHILGTDMQTLQAHTLMQSYTPDLKSPTFFQGLHLRLWGSCEAWEFFILRKLCYIPLRRPVISAGPLLPLRGKGQTQGVVFSCRSHADSQRPILFTNSLIPKLVWELSEGLLVDVAAEKVCWRWGCFRGSN